jgi:hypothetical protein
VGENSSCHIARGHCESSDEYKGQMGLRIAWKANKRFCFLALSHCLSEDSEIHARFAECNVLTESNNIPIIDL